MKKRCARAVFPATLLVSAALVLPGLAPPASAEQSFTAMVGAYGRSTAYAESGEPADLIGSVDLLGRAGWRSSLAGGGYLAAQVQAQVYHYLVHARDIDDRELAWMELALPSGRNRVKVTAGLDLSLGGFGDEPGYLSPDWELHYVFQRGRRSVEPYLAYQGSFFFQPDTNDDLFAQGGAVGFTYRPSIRHGYELAAGGRWETWYQYDILDAGGSPTGDTRRDYVIFLEGGADGLLGFFAGWQVDAELRYRLSDANRYLDDAGILDEDSETRTAVTLEGGLGWSPTRKVNMELGAYGEYAWYRGREALDAGGSPAGEKLSVVSVGGDVRVDWTADDHWYLVLGGSGGYRGANDPEETRWYASLRGGVEYGF
jgi:hypothetical protein